MPWMTYWTNSNYKWSGKRIRQFGLNMNAPGDRTSENKTLWIEYPFLQGYDLGIPVKIDTVGFSRIRKEPISVASEETPWVSASAVGGIRSMEIVLSTEAEVTEGSYTINLHFSELESKKPGERVFDVKVQGKTVLDNFDIVKEAGRTDKEIVKTFSGIVAGETLKLELVPVKGNTILSGIELIEEKMATK